MLAEHRELLGQVTVAGIRLFVALARRDAPIRPRMEGMRTATAHGDVVALALLDQSTAQVVQILCDLVHRGMRQGIDLDHAFGDFEFDVSVATVVIHGAQQIGSAARQIEIAGRQQLQFQLDPQSQGIALSEFKNIAHITPPGATFSFAVSPARLSAKRHSTGPAISMIAAARNARTSADGPISG